MGAGRTLGLAAAAAGLASMTLLIGGPAKAATDVTAEGVALADGADCDDSSLDLTLTSGDIDREAGKASILDGTVEGEFEQNSNSLDNSNSETFEGYGVDLDTERPDGTIIGTYAYLGDTPPTAAGTAEFFVLYGCSTSGASNETLYTCFGDYGTCPQTAEDANAPVLDAPAEAAVGSEVSVTGKGCYDGGGAGYSVTLEGDTESLVKDDADNADGDLSFTFTMPDVPEGTALTITVACDASAVAGTATISAPGAAPTTPTPAPAAPTPAEVQPSFTG